MRTFISIVFLGIIAMTLFGCGSSSATVGGTNAGDIPDWYTSVPKDPAIFFATSSQVSGDMQLAVDKATNAARTELGRMVETKISGLQKRFTEETGTANNAQLLDMFTQASKNVVSTSLSGSKESKRKIVKDGSSWRAYVMDGRFDIGDRSIAMNVKELYDYAQARGIQVPSPPSFVPTEPVSSTMSCSSSGSANT